MASLGPALGGRAGARIGPGLGLGLARGEARQRRLEVLGEGVGARVLGQPVEPGEMREQQPVGIAAAGGDDHAVVEHFLLDPVDRAAGERVLRPRPRREQRALPGEPEPRIRPPRAIGGLRTDIGRPRRRADAPAGGERLEKSDLPRPVELGPLAGLRRLPERLDHCRKIEWSHRSASFA